MKIVVLDGYTLNPGDNPWTSVEQHGGLTVDDRTPNAKVVERALDAEDNPLLHARNIFITPHIARAALEARRRLMQTTAENSQAFRNGASINVVN